MATVLGQTISLASCVTVKYVAQWTDVYPSFGICCPVVHHRKSLFSSICGLLRFVLFSF